MQLTAVYTSIATMPHIHKDEAAKTANCMGLALSSTAEAKDVDIRGFIAELTAAIPLSIVGLSK